MILVYSFGDSSRMHAHVILREYQSMNGENQPLVTDEPNEFEVKDFKKTTHQFRGGDLWNMPPNFSKRKNHKVTTCNRLDLGTLGSRPVMPKTLPQTLMMSYDRGEPAVSYR